MNRQPIFDWRCRRCGKKGTVVPLEKRLDAALHISHAAAQPKRGAKCRRPDLECEERQKDSDMPTVLETEVQISGRAGSEIEVTLRGSGEKIFSVLINGMSVDELMQLSNAISTELGKNLDEAQAVTK